MRFPLALAPVAIVAALVAADASADPTTAQPVATPVAMPSTGAPRLDTSATSAPGNAKHRLVAFSEYVGSPLVPRTGWASTLDGVAWHTGQLTTVTPNGAATASTVGRPSVAWSPSGPPTGTVYMAYETKGSSTCDSAGAGIDFSLSTDAGTAATASFGSTTRVATTNLAGSGLSRTWPSVAVDASGAPLVAFATSTAPGCGSPSGTNSAIKVATPTDWPNAATTDWVPWGIVTSTDEDAYDYPSLVALPGAAGGVAVAYLHRTSTNAGKVEVIVCDDVTNCAGTPPAFVSASFSLARSASILGGIPVTSAPSLAVAPDGSLDVTYTKLNDSGDLDVMLASSDATRQSWGDPVSVAGPGGQAADEFMPSVSVVAGGAASGRVDVAYLDDRSRTLGVPSATQYAAYQTSFRGGLRGGDVPLSAAALDPPLLGSTPALGSRMASLSLWTSTPATQLGRTFAYWPARSGSSTATVYEGQLGHGLTAPVLTADPPAGTSIQKNTPTAGKVPASWANVSDADGDPVAVGTSTSAPPPAKDNGQVSGTTYTPPADFAGTAFVVVSATDALNSTTVSHRMIVFDTPPQWLSSTSPVATGKEGTNGLTVALAAIDADPSDAVTYSASLPPELVGHVRFTPASGPASTMTIDLPRGYRPGTATIKIHARDTTPTAGGDSVATLFLNVIPSYAAPTVNVQTITSGTAAELDFHDAAWSDKNASCAEAGIYCHYHFEYSVDGAPVQTTTLLYSPVRTYSIGTHSFKVRVWISTPSGDTPISPFQTGQFAITVDPRKALKVRTKRAGRQLKVSITALYAGTVRVSLYTRGKRRLFREITFNQTVLSGSVKLPLAGIRVRTGTLTIGYSGGFQAAGGAPQALVRRVWFR